MGHSFCNATRLLTVEGPWISLGEPCDDRRLDSAGRIQQRPRSPGELWNARLNRFAKFIIGDPFERGSWTYVDAAVEVMRAIGAEVLRHFRSRRITCVVRIMRLVGRSFP